MADETTDPLVPNIIKPEPTEEQLARAEKLAPLVKFVNSAAYKKVIADLTALQQPMMNEEGYSHLFGIISIMPRLKQWVEAQ